MIDPRRLAEMRETGATAHRHMLTSVDHLTGGRIVERTRTATEAIARFENRDPIAARGERGRRGQSRQAAADDEDVAG